MKPTLSLRAVPILTFAFLIALPDLAGAGSMRSGTARQSTPSPVPVTVPVPAQEDYAYGSLGTADNAAIIQLKVPADAQVWFDDKATSLTGSVRPFTTPALESGKDYSYEIRARWTEAGRQVEQTRKVNFRSGDRMTLNFAVSR
jgi:uncharacterized protein (TIGR03000 family)